MKLEDLTNLTDWQTKDVLFLIKGNSCFLGLDFKVIAELYRQFSEQNYSASWLTLNNNDKLKDAFIKWATRSPMQVLLEELEE